MILKLFVVLRHQMTRPMHKCVCERVCVSNYEPTGLRRMTLLIMLPAMFLFLCNSTVNASHVRGSVSKCVNLLLDAGLA